jgi:hypothetical protein
LPLPVLEKAAGSRFYIHSPFRAHFSDGDVVAVLVFATLPNARNMNPFSVPGCISEQFRLIHARGEPHGRSRVQGVEVEHDLRGTWLSGMHRDSAWGIKV